MLVERRADTALPDGRKFGLGGFQVIDPEVFLALPEATVLAWRKAGLGLGLYHLASLDLFQGLLRRKARRDAELSSKSDIEPVEPALVL